MKIVCFWGFTYAWYRCHTNRFILAILFGAFCLMAPVRAVLAQEKVLPAIEKLLDIQLSLNGSRFSALGTHTVLFGDDLIWKTERKACTVGVVFYLNEPVGGQKRLDGSSGLAVVGDAYQIDLGVIDPRQSVDPQPVCLKYDTNQNCLENGVSVGIRVPLLSHETWKKVVQASPVWKRPDGKMFLPRNTDWEENPEISLLNGSAPALLGSQDSNPNMNLLFRDGEVSNGLELLSDIVSKCRLNLLGD